MTANVDIVNQALQIIGTRTTITATELANAASGNNALSSNEAINANLIMFRLRDNLNRMAPWNCVTKYAPLVYITAAPGQPENPNQAAPYWQPGIPPPGWAYEYQYPVDCLRVRKVIPQTVTQGFGSIPIYPPGVVTSVGYNNWTGPPVKSEVTTDSFFGVTAAAVAAGGAGYAVGDLITLVQPSYTFSQNSAPVGQPPVLTPYTMDAGTPVQLVVLTAPGGVVATVAVVNQVQGEANPIGGSYFSVQANPVAQGLTSGVGAGATFNLTFGAQAPQRVILTQQGPAILCYNAQITDPNVMDQMFIDAWAGILGARLVPALQGDKSMIKVGVDISNSLIMEARKADGNEAGPTVNDVVPDFIRTRGIVSGPNFEFSPNMDWGGLWGY
jgi:hypothetical protein